MYDYLIVGAGLFGSVFAYEAKKCGKKCLVIDKRSHFGGNIYTEEMENIQVHKYGAHIFHTSNRRIWDFINQFASFNRYTNSPIARYHDELYNLPFNMNTFNKMWNVITPSEAKKKIREQIVQSGITEPKNLEEQAISLVGRDIYEKLIKGYTEKQWGRPAAQLPSFIIKRLPVRYTYDNNYFNDKYQGIPIGGYTQIIEKMLTGIEIQLNTDFFKNKAHLLSVANKIVFTGMIDEYFNYCYGELEYRSLQFKTKVLNEENFQGNAVVNYTANDVPYTRIIEHKHFEFEKQGGYENAESHVNQKTVITWEFPSEWKHGDEPYYPMNDEKNNALYKKYKDLARWEKRVIFGGRLGSYRYFDMHDVISEALRCVESELQPNKSY